MTLLLEAPVQTKPRRTEEEKSMAAGISHPYYRVVEAGFARGYWIGICKLCPRSEVYQTAKAGTSHHAERALWDHLRAAHDKKPQEAR